ncbi:MAG TPA: NepR family anti-sigma factor [Sphingomonas sp.]
MKSSDKPIKADDPTRAVDGGDSAGALPTKTSTRGRDMGSALRSVYQQTVEEKVPDEMMDLLGKLD